MANHSNGGNTKLSRSGAVHTKKKPKSNGEIPDYTDGAKVFIA